MMHLRKWHIPPPVCQRAVMPLLSWAFLKAPNSSASAPQTHLPVMPTPQHPFSTIPVTTWIRVQQRQKPCNRTNRPVHLLCQTYISFLQVFPSLNISKGKKPNTTHLKNANRMKTPRVNSQGFYVNARVIDSIKTKGKSLGQICKWCK